MTAAGMTARAQVRRRRLSSVLLDGLGPAGAWTALHLAAAGVGTLLLRDGGEVSAAQVGRPYLTVHHGVSRVSALQDLLGREERPPAVVDCPADMRPAASDICVLLREGMPTPAEVAAASAGSTLVLPVGIGAETAEAGPLLARPEDLQGFACAACWRPQQERDREAPGRDGPKEGPETLLEQAVAVLIARQLLILLDGVRRPELTGCGMSLGPDGGVAQHPVRPQSDCECQLCPPEPLPS